MKKIYANEREARKAWRERTSNASTKKYEKTKKGFLMRTYRNMESRINGIQKQKAYLYAGKSLLPRADFYEFSLTSNSFHNLFAEWEANSYNQKLTPSINRIDASKGYELGNMEWITHSENSRRTLRWGYA